MKTSKPKSAIATPRRRPSPANRSRDDFAPLNGELKLTSLSSCAGCAAKLGQSLLAEMLQHLPTVKHPKLLVDSNTADDAGIYQLRPDLALVQTVDFFTPIVDSPFDFGQIAATNALSDVYAMGGRPITAMNLLAVPTDKLNADAIVQILKGGAVAVKKAGALIVGGHTIKTLEPIYGLSVTGIVHPKRVLTNTAAQPGDVLILTKPLGTGIATTALKRGICSPDLLAIAVKWMTTLNDVGADLAQRKLVKAATDITGFGLLGHLANIVRGSGVVAQIDSNAVPPLHESIFDLIDRDCIPGGTRTNLQAAESIVEWNNVAARNQILLADAQTSGGLLLCVAKKNIGVVVKLLRSKKVHAAVIGNVLSGPHPKIIVNG